jgi:hypothetical protein
MVGAREPGSGSDRVLGATGVRPEGAGAGVVVVVSVTCAVGINRRSRRGSVYPRDTGSDAAASLPPNRFRSIPSADGVASLAVPRPGASWLVATVGLGIAQITGRRVIAFLSANDPGPVGGDRKRRSGTWDTVSPHGSCPVDPGYTDVRSSAGGVVVLGRRRPALWCVWPSS